MHANAFLMISQQSLGHVFIMHVGLKKFSIITKILYLFFIYSLEM